MAVSLELILDSPTVLFNVDILAHWLEIIIQVFLFQVTNATVLYFDLMLRLAIFLTNGLNLFEHVPSRDNLSKDNVLAIQMALLVEGNKELTVVGVWSRIGHRQHPWIGVAQLEAFVFKKSTIYGFAAAAVTLGYVSSLAHELGHNAMENTSEIFELAPVVTFNECDVISDSARHDVFEQFNYESASDNIPFRRISVQNVSLERLDLNV